MEPLEARWLLSVVPRNVIVMIGDGMGFEHVEAGRYALDSTGNTLLSSEGLLYQAELGTYSADSAVTDSAAAGTAMATGQKVNNGVVSTALPGDGAELKTSLEAHRDLGKATGLVTTSFITDATPAAFAAHESSRANTSQIAGDYLYQTRPEVLFGGGGNGMSPTAASEAGYTVVSNRLEMQALDADAATLVSGQFGTGPLPYEADGLGDLPHLSEMTTTALDILDNDPDGFFLLVEDELNDEASHANDLARMQSQVVEFSHAVQVVLDWVETNSNWTETLVIVAADHETGGLNFDFATGNYSWTTTGHTSANVPVYGQGPGSERLVGTLDNTDVFALTTEQPFSVVLLPDTQRYTEQDLPHFATQTQWIADHLAEENLVMVSQVGDLVQNDVAGSQQTADEWTRADAAMDTLDGVPLPYSALPGNHDFDTSSTHTSAEAYISHFGASRYAGQTWYGGSSSDQTSHYQVFSAGGRDFLHIALEWEPREEAMTWAQGVIDANPDLPVILSTHSYLDTAGHATEKRTAEGHSGLEIFEELVSPNPQIFMVLSGHFGGENHQVSYNDAGLEVIEILADYQSRPNGGDGWMQLLEFYPEVDLIEVRTYSPSLDALEIDANSQFTFQLDFDSRFDFDSPPQTVSFQQGAGGYSGAVDTFLQEESPDADNSGAGSLNVDQDDPVGSSLDVQAVIRFDGIFGTDPGQIPADARIDSARLELEVTNEGNAIRLHRILQPWSDTDTWNSWDGGIQTDGVESAAAAEATTDVALGALSIDVTTSLLAWQADPVGNFGWAMLSTGDNGVDFQSAEGANPPKLVVRYAITEPNEAPVAGDDDYTTAEDTLLSVSDPGVLGNDMDADGDPLSALLVGDATHGTLTLAPDGSFTYLPDADFAGADAFTYRASDGKTNGNPATVTITVAPVNDAPVAADDSYSVDEDNTLTIPTSGVLANDADADGDPLSAVLVSDVTHGTLTLSSDGAFSYTPDVDFYGTDSFAYKADDGQLDSETATVMLTVLAVNDAPVSNDDAAATAEDTPVNVNVLANDTDAEGNPLTITVVGSTNGTATVLDSGTPSDPTDDTVEFTPTANFSGTASFTYRVSDGQLDSQVATATIAVAPVNDAPVAADDGYNTQQGTPLAVIVPGVLGNDTDVEGDNLTAVLVENVSNGTLVLESDGAFAYTPAADFAGIDTFTYRASDGSAEGNLATVTITVEAAATVTTFDSTDVPKTLRDPNKKGNPRPTTSALTAGVPDLLVTDLQVQLSILPPDEIDPAGYMGTVSGQLAAPDGTTVPLFDVGAASQTEMAIDVGQFDGTLLALGNWALELRDHVADGFAGTLTAWSLVVTSGSGGPANTPPVANDDNASTAVGMPVAVDVLANDMDPDGDPMVITAVTDPPNGSAVDNGDGTISYTPNPTFEGTDTFTYTISDGNGGTDTATVTVTVGDVPSEQPWHSTDTPLPIADYHPVKGAVATESAITPDGTVQATAIEVTITHDSVSELTVSLTSPNDEVLVLSDPQSVTIVSGQPSRYENLGLADAAGTWVLQITDSAKGNRGVLESWTLYVTPATEGAASASGDTLLAAMFSEPASGATATSLIGAAEPTGGMYDVTAQAVDEVLAADDPAADPPALDLDDDFVTASHRPFQEPSATDLALQDLGVGSAGP